MEEDKMFLTVKQAAAAMGISYEMIRDFTIKGYFPSPISMDGHGGGLRYRKSFIESWIKEREEEA